MLIRIDDKLKEEIRQEAKALGLSMSAYIRLILIKRNK